MKRVIFVFIIVFGVCLSFLALRSASREKSKVLGEAEPQTPSEAPTSAPSPSPSPTPEPTIEPTPSPSPKPTPTPIPQPRFTSQEINGFIERFAAQYAVDPNVLRHIAICESDFDPFAQYVGYTGLYQFGPVTWANLRKQIGEDTNPNLRFNAEEAVQTAAYALSQGKTGIWPNCAP